MSAAAALAIFCLALWPTPLGCAGRDRRGRAVRSAGSFGRNRTGSAAHCILLVERNCRSLPDGWDVGPPLTPHFGIYALGYRLGGQFLFANDWLMLMALTAVAGRPRLVDSWLTLWVERGHWFSRSNAARVLHLGTGVGLAGLTVLYVVGLSTFGARAWDGYTPFGSACHPRAFGIRPVRCRRRSSAAICRGAASISSASNVERGGACQATRRITDFHGRCRRPHLANCWTNRTRALFYQQDVSLPFQFNDDRTDVEFHGLLPESVWRNRAGAWLVRSFREAGPYARSSLFMTPRRRCRCSCRCLRIDNPSIFLVQSIFVLRDMHPFWILAVTFIRTTQH